MTWRIYTHRTSERWTTYLEDSLGNPENGLDLPAGARIHSIAPVTTRRLTDEYNGAEAEIEEVLEWVIFYGLELEEEPRG